MLVCVAITIAITVKYMLIRSMDWMDWMDRLEWMESKLRQQLQLWQLRRWMW